MSCLKNIPTYVFKDPSREKSTQICQRIARIWVCIRYSASYVSTLGPLNRNHVITLTSQSPNWFILRDLTSQIRCELAQYAFACDVLYCNFFCVAAEDLIHHYSKSHKQDWSSHSKNLLCLSDACHTHDGQRHKDNSTASHNHGQSLSDSSFQSHSHSQAQDQTNTQSSSHSQEGHDTHHVAPIECQVCKAEIGTYWEHHSRDACGYSEPITLKPSVHAVIHSVHKGTEHREG